MSKHCKFLRKDGAQCRADVQIGQDICVFHDPSKVEIVRHGRCQGGIKRSRQRFALPCSGMADRSLNTSLEISSFLGDSINQLCRGQLDSGVARTIGYLVTVKLASLKQGRLEQHISQLEDLLGVSPRSLISNHVLGKQPTSRSIEHRTERVRAEIEFKMWIRMKRMLESLGDEELRHLADTGQWPSRPDPLPGTSRFDKLERKELLQLWKEDQEKSAGHNEQEWTFYANHGHWPEQGCGADCAAVGADSGSSDLLSNFES